MKAWKFCLYRCKFTAIHNSNIFRLFNKHIHVCIKIHNESEYMYSYGSMVPSLCSHVLPPDWEKQELIKNY